MKKSQREFYHFIEQKPPLSSESPVTPSFVPILSTAAEISQGGQTIACFKSKRELARREVRYLHVDLADSLNLE
jgi:hypothetical protein